MPFNEENLAWFFDEDSNEKNVPQNIPQDSKEQNQNCNPIINRNLNQNSNQSIDSRYFLSNIDLVKLKNNDGGLIHFLASELWTALGKKKIKLISYKKLNQYYIKADGKNKYCGICSKQKLKIPFKFFCE